MTVGELIEKLQQFDPNMLVMVDGYEGGVDELRQVGEREVILNYHKDVWYYGRHEVHGYLLAKEKDKYQTITAVYLPR